MARKKQEKPRPPEQIDAAKGYARNPGVDKQRDTAPYWRREAMRLRPAGDALIALGGTQFFDYASVLGCAMYVGYHGVSRSLTGGYQMGVGHPAALALVRAEQRHLARRAKVLESKLDTLVGESAEIPEELVIDGKGIRKADTPTSTPDADDSDMADAA